MASERLFRRAKRGVWYAWFYDEQQNRVRFSTHCRNKRAAEAALSKAEQGAFGVGAGVRGYTLSDALEQLVETGCIDKSTATAEMYKRKAGHLLRLLGETRRLGSLSMDAISGFIAARQQEGAKSGTIYKELVTLRRALKLARQNGKYRLDPSAIIPPFRNRYQPRERWMTEDEDHRQEDQAHPAPHQGRPRARPRGEAPAEEQTKRPAPAKAARPAKAAAAGAEPRLPAVGTTVKKTDRCGKVRCECKIEKDGVHYEGKVYGSLSGAAVAAAKDLGLPGNSFNGFVFWGLGKPNRAAADPTLRLEQLWKRYAEVVGAAMQGERKAEVAKLARIHGAQLDALLG